MSARIEKRRIEVPIERGIPIPPLAKKARSFCPMRLAMMKIQIGESILCKTEGSYQSATRSAQRVGIKVTARRVEEGWRLWRIA